MNVVDAIIILFIVFGAIMGLKHGFTRQLVSFLGILVITVLSFFLKNYISVFLYENLPFFSFGGIFKGVTVLNIALYEVIAFLIVFSILMVIFQVVLLCTKIFEKILTFTIILGITSKILGALVGVVQYYVILFIILYIISLPFFSGNLLKGSKYAEPILKHTPILSSNISRTMDVFDEFANLKEEYENSDSADEFNRETLDLFLKYKVITVDSAERLVEKGKLNVDHIDKILDKYREDE